MLEVADKYVEPVSIAHLQKTNPPRVGCGSFVPSDEAMSRESIYPGLI
jgi:hypothetical protein